MQNQQNALPNKRDARLTLRAGELARPKIVLMGAGLVGLLLDLFIQPISSVGLALILLATAPWILQAWSERGPQRAHGVSTVGASAERATRNVVRGSELQHGGGNGERAVGATGATGAEQPPRAARDNGRGGEVAMSAPPRQPATQAGSEIKRRPSPRENQQIGTNSMRTK